MSVDVLDESGWDADLVELTRLGRFVLDRMRIHPQAELCIKLVDEDTIANLNEHYLDKAGPTDVLAFPMDELRPGRDSADDADSVVGDVALCPQVAAAQAAGNGHSASHEIDLLTVHGILHLLGYDHAEPAEHDKMFALQARLLAEWQGVRRGEDVEA
jgi:probable rRNA maturation factor